MPRNHGAAPLSSRVVAVREWWGELLGASLRLGAISRRKYLGASAAELRTALPCSGLLRPFASGLRFARSEALPFQCALGGAR